MKPNFALSLSFDGIRLLLRAAGGWQLVGEVDVATPDLASALAELRMSAMALRPEGIRTKLIIPDEQIRYLSTDSGSLNEEDRSEVARAALEGATPYPVDALAFDISIDGGVTHIAAVARETLSEAEAFATEHEFNPVSFVAAPEKAEFLGEPFFGATAKSKTLLADGEIVEPDGIRVVVVGDAPPAPTVDEADASTNREVITPPDRTTGQNSDTGVLVLGSETQTGGNDVPEGPANVPEPDDAKAPLSDAQNPQNLDSASALDGAQDEAADKAPEADPKQANEDAPAEQPATVQSPEITEDLDQSSTESTSDKSNGSAEPDVPSPNSNPAPEKSPALGFASRRGSKAATATPLGGVTRRAPPAPPIVKPTPMSPAAPPKDPPQAAIDSLRPMEPGAAPEPKVARADAFLSRRKPAQPARADASGQSSAAHAPSAAKAEDPRVTGIGARDTAPVGGKPRYLGLILMAALLIFLAAVAAWASIFLDDGLARLFPGRERTLASTLPEQTQSSIANDVGETTTASNETRVDNVELASLNDTISDGLTSEDAAVLDALRDPLPDPQDAQKLTEETEALDEDALDARYAVTGIWSKAPESVTPSEIISLEDLYITGIDPISPALDAVALPQATSFQTDAQLAVVTSPVAAGTNFALGSDGRVIATVEGALSPDGHTVFLGRPPVIPPATPVRFATDPTEVDTLQTVTQVRPRARPSDLIEQNERATLGGLSRSELAGLRPRLRPQALQQQAEEQQQAETPDDAAPSALATAQSLRPKTRPKGFARLVARATPDLGSTAAVTKAPASIAPRTVKPSIPSSASVSREATTRNAINLRRVNLIGVYGKPSDRRALVRLSNGRYRKVQVGDRIDGGSVSAIGDSELRYQKGTRNLTLKMPKG